MKRLHEGESPSVMPAVAARFLKISLSGLRKLTEAGKIRYWKTIGEPSIRLYRLEELRRVGALRDEAALRRRRRKVQRTLFPRPTMLKIATLPADVGPQLQLPLRAAKGERSVSTSLPKPPKFGRRNRHVA